jgi:hypothetical protein
LKVISGGGDAMFVWEGAIALGNTLGIVVGIQQVCWGFSNFGQLCQTLEFVSQSGHICINL